MNLKKALKSQKGSALIWALCAATIVLILVGGSMTLATAYHEKALNETVAKQSYFSALSAAELVADEIVGDSTFASVDELIASSSLIPAKTINNDNAETMNVELSDDMGECSVKIYWKDDTTLVVKSAAQYKDTEDTVSVELKYSSSMVVTDSDSAQKNIFVSKNEIKDNSLINFNDTNMYLYENTEIPTENWVLGVGSELFLKGEILKDYDELISSTVKVIPTEVDVIKVESEDDKFIETLLSKIESGKTYVIYYSSKSKLLDLSIGFSDYNIGDKADVYLVIPNVTGGGKSSAVNLNSIQEGIEFYYYGYDDQGQLNMGVNGEVLNIFGGVYTNGNVTFRGDVNFRKYLFLDNESVVINTTGNNEAFDVGYARATSLRYSWGITRYND